MIRLLTEQLGSKLGKSLNLAPRQANRFASQARKSTIGGEGAEFKNMSLADQNAFIKSYNEANPGGGTSTSETLIRQRNTRKGSGQLSPQEKMQHHDTQRAARDKGLAARFDTGRGEREALEARRQPIMKQAVEAAPARTHETIPGYYDPLVRTPQRSIPKTGAENPRSALHSDIPRPTESGDGILKQAASAVGKAGRATEEAAMNAYQGSGLQKVMNVFAGDTSGKAAANAGAEFMAGAERVFTGDAGRAVSGLEGDGASDILKQAWGAADDDAFKAAFKDSGISEDAIGDLRAFKSEIQKVDNEGGQLSEAGMSAMMKNQGELGSMYGGFNRAGASASPNALLRAIGGESGHGFGNAMGIAAVAGLAGGANVAMGGDFTEGAAVGGGVAFGARAIAKGVAGSMGDIESAMVKNILGDDAVTAGTREVTKNVDTTVKRGTPITELLPSENAHLKMSDVTNYQKTTIGDENMNAWVANNPSTRVKTKADLVTTKEVTETETVTGAQARKQNLTSIAAMKDNDERLKGFGKKKMQKLLDPNKKKNVAMNNRLLTLGGGMLAGVAFTGQSDKRNYRRGFNAHRGNRI